MNEEHPSRIGIALFIATLLALGAIVMAEAFGVVFFEDPKAELVVQEKADQHAHIYSALVACLNGPTIIKIADQPAAYCEPRTK